MKSLFEQFGGTYRKVTYINLLTSGKLNAYLVKIDRQVQDRILGDCSANETRERNCSIIKG